MCTSHVHLRSATPVVRARADSLLSHVKGVADQYHGPYCRKLHTLLKIEYQDAVAKPAQLWNAVLVPSGFNIPQGAEQDLHCRYAGRPSSHVMNWRSLSRGPHRAFDRVRCLKIYQAMKCGRAVLRPAHRHRTLTHQT